MDTILRNNTGNKTKSILIDGFVIRLKVFNNLFNEIKFSNSDKNPQNYLIIGQRGAGKTTLLFRLKYAIEDDTNLKHIIPIMFNEEQYNLTELINLWENISEYLDEYPEFDQIYSNIQALNSGKDHDEKAACAFLENALNKNKRKIIVFIENIDTLMKKIGRGGQTRLLEVLSGSSNITIIGSSTTYFESIVNSDEPCYNFFKIVQLHGLTKAESYKLINRLGIQSNEKNQIENILKHNPSRVEALRRITGGNPRTMSYLFQIFLDNANGKAIKDLYKLLDDLTFLYKSELDQLSPQQQKVIDVIARNWDAVSVKEIALISKMLSKHISSVLYTLEKNQVIEIINTKNRNNLYRIKDRFLNIWYLMRFGRKRDKENIIWLVRFYDAWCNKSELSERVLHHINNLQGGNYDNIAALDMVNTFLSCKNVSHEDKYKLFKTTKSYLPKELIRDLKISKEIWFDTIKGLVKQKNFDQAIDVLEDIEIKDTAYYTFAYWIYYNKGDFTQAAECLEIVFDQKQDSLTAFTLANILERKTFETDKAIKYYQLALEKGNYEAAYRLGQIYFYYRNDFNDSVKYHEIAISSGVIDSIMALATIYFSRELYSEAKRLCLLAIEKGDIGAMDNLAILLQGEGDFEGAEEMLNNAIKLGCNHALVSLGNLYLNSPLHNDAQAKAIFEEAVEKNAPEAYYALGKYLLRNEKNVASALKVLKHGANNNDENSAHLLAHYYHEISDWKRAEKWFIESFKMGKHGSLVCLSNCAFFSNRDDRKEFILQQFENYYKPFYVQGPLILVEYLKLLVWNEKTQDSIKYLKDYEFVIEDALQDEGEEYKGELVSVLTSFFIRLLAKKQYDAIKEIFRSETVNYKQVLKPVYFAFVNYLKDEYPNEYLKAGSELEETIDEIMATVEKVKLLDYSKY